MAIENGELVMELMYEEKSDLKLGRVYDVKIGGSTRKKGIYWRMNQKGFREIFVNSSIRDRYISPRTYSFKNYSVEGNNLDIKNVSGPRLYSKEDLGVKNLLGKLEENKK